MSRPRAPHPDTLPDDLVRDQGRRDLLADGRLRDLHVGRSMQDLVHDQGVQEAIRLGALPPDQFPTAVRIGLSRGRSGGFATGTWRRKSAVRKSRSKRTRARGRSAQEPAGARGPSGARERVPSDLPSRGPKVRHAAPDRARSLSRSGRGPLRSEPGLRVVEILAPAGELARAAIPEAPAIVPPTRPAMPSPPGSRGSSRHGSRPPVLPPSPAVRPHKLGKGEILVLRIGPTEVVTAVNRRGRFVIQRHSLPP
jgi:hypothetical protein